MEPEKSRAVLAQRQLANRRGEIVRIGARDEHALVAEDAEAGGMGGGHERGLSRARTPAHHDGAPRTRHGARVKRAPAPAREEDRGGRLEKRTGEEGEKRRRERRRLL